MPFRVPAVRLSGCLAGGGQAWGRGSGSGRGVEAAAAPQGPVPQSPRALVSERVNLVVIIFPDFSNVNLRFSWLNV